MDSNSKGEFGFRELLYDLLLDLRNFEFVRIRLSKEEELLQHALNTVHGRHQYLLMAASSAKSYLLNARRCVFQPRLIESDRIWCGCFHHLGARSGFLKVELSTDRHWFKTMDMLQKGVLVGSDLPDTFFRGCSCSFIAEHTKPGEIRFEMIDPDGCTIYSEDLLFEELLVMQERASTPDDLFLEKGRIEVHLPSLVQLCNELFCIK